MVMMMMMAMTIMNYDDAGAPRLGRPGELQHPGGEDHQAQRAIGSNGKMTLLGHSGEYGNATKSGGKMSKSVMQLISIHF